MVKRVRWTTLLIFSFCLSMTLSACGSGGGASAPAAANEGKPSSSTTGTSQGAAAQEIKIQLATTEPNDHNVTSGAAKFKELIEQMSNGRIKVELFPNLQLGSLREQVEMTQMGSIQITTSPLSTVSAFAGDLAVLELPFLFDNEQQMWNILDGDVGDLVLSALEGTGLKGIGIWGGGYKQITSGKKPITSPADLEGLKIRVIPSDALIAQYKSWGANPIPIDFSELYTALQQGTVDAQENPTTTILSKKLYEVQTYLSITNHAYQYHIFMANEKWFDSLSEEDRRLIEEAESEARVFSREMQMQQEETNVNVLEAQGMKINTLTPEAVEQFREKSASLYSQIANTEGKKAILEAIQSAVKAAK